MTTETTSPAGPAGAPATYAERRAAMADETRTRILEACVAILGRGVTELSIPAVAREAGVSVPTVYRNFPDKKTLVEQTALHLRALRGPFGPPAALDDIPGHLVKMFTHAASLNESVRAALWSEPVIAQRHASGEIETRMKQVETLFASVLAGLTGADREHAVRFATVMCSSATSRAFSEVAGATPEQAAETVAWALARAFERPWGGTKPSKTKRRSQAGAKGQRK